METALIPRQALATIVENVAQARSEVAHAFTLLVGAKARLKAVLGSEHSYYDSLWSQNIADYHLEEVAKSVDAHVAKNAWNYVIAQIGLRAYMTEARQKELHDQLDKGQFPPLTVENILGTLQGLTSQVGTLLQESAKEVFDWLRPQSNYGVGALKTNNKWKIGEKVIVGYVVESAGRTGGYHFIYHREGNFRALGNVFSLLDGQGAQQYPHDLCTQLRDGLRHVGSGEMVKTPYLTLKPYKNGNAHLHFARRDLVDQLNQLGSDGVSLGEKT